MDKTRLCELADFAFRVRRNCIRMTNHGQSGHVGSMLSMAEIITVLYNGVLKNVSADNPENPMRDRFILSKVTQDVQCMLLSLKRDISPKTGL